MILVYKRRMDPNMVYVVAAFIPIVAIATAVGAPVAIYLGRTAGQLMEPPATAGTEETGALLEPPANTR